MKYSTFTYKNDGKLGYAFSLEEWSLGFLYKDNSTKREDFVMARKAMTAARKTFGAKGDYFMYHRVLDNPTHPRTKWVNGRPQYQDHNGTCFNTIKEMCAHWNVPYRRVCYYLKVGVNLKTILEGIV